MTSRALLVIDVQNRYVTGGWRVEYPPVEETLGRIEEAIRAARDHDVPVVAIRQRWPVAASMTAEDLELAPQIATRPDGPPLAEVVDKTLPSAFAGTVLGDALATMGTSRLTLCGYMTQNCVQATAFDAVNRGFAVEVLADACGSVSLRTAAGRAGARALHETTLTVLASRFAGVVNVADWRGLLEDGKAVEPDGLDTEIG